MTAKKNIHEIGILGEKLAQEYLKNRGYHLIECNYRCTEGEIDIITSHDHYLVFVEVRTRTSRSYGTPEESVTSAKKRHLLSSAFRYLQTHEKLPKFWRIDFIAVEMTKDNKVLRINHIENAIN